MSIKLNPINPRKLLLSTWTAARPQAGEKHFQVVKLYCDQQDRLIDVELLAVVTRRSRRIAWQGLKSGDDWLSGWL